jgi:hypothetical protein
MGHSITIPHLPTWLLTAEHGTECSSMAVAAQAALDSGAATMRPVSVSRNPTGRAVELHIIHFNDVYNVEPRDQEPVGGAARFVFKVRHRTLPSTLQCGFMLRQLHVWPSHYALGVAPEKPGANLCML